MILPIAKLPAKILRTPVEDVKFPLNKETVRLLKNMLDTVISAQGVGLAAPQVSKNLNMALIYLDDADIPPFPIINPKITHRSKETTEMEEGCLSMPGVFGMVRRPKKITMEAYDVDGEKFTITDDTFLARVLQHEIDHLDNTLIYDKLENITKGEEILPNYSETK
ncbi:MAG TPA: peptide deformylase [Patescibacteria group bacterium]|jgi:peptide deformylase|nr:peptide deformylase [Patescibacteria group bacterium]